jgi:hypothetical protein
MYIRRWPNRPPKDTFGGPFHQEIAITLDKGLVHETHLPDQSASSTGILPAL